jgi:hypothetical protein
MKAGQKVTICEDLIFVNGKPTKRTKEVLDLEKGDTFTLEGNDTVHEANCKQQIPSKIYLEGDKEPRRVIKNGDK